MEQLTLKWFTFEILFYFGFENAGKDKLKFYFILGLNMLEKINHVW